MESSQSQPDDCNIEFLSLNGIPTEVMTFGPSIPEILDLEKKPDYLILMIPGNPGVVKYYEEFMRSIFKSFNGIYPVWGISHAGHSKEPEEDENNAYRPTISGSSIDKYSLEGQVKHKKFFIKDFIPADIRLVLIGHSIGAYMSLELLNILPSSQIAKTILLFPTIERMAVSPNGKWTTPFVTYFHFLPPFLAYFATFFSREFKLKLIRWYFKGTEMPDCISEASLNMFEPSVVKSWIRLAKDEMEKVVEVNSATIDAHKDKLMFYYGGSDNWCPVSYYQDMRNMFPELDVKLCERGIEHAFVLASSQEMAEEVSAWLTDKVFLNQE